MPSKSPAQHHLMEAVLHDRVLSGHLGIPQDVARKFVQADKRKESKTRERMESPAQERREKE